MDALRLAFGTLTILPVRAPRAVDRRVASWAMVLAPLTGLALAVAVTTVLWIASPGALDHEPPAHRLFPGAGPLLAAVLCVAAVAVLTRAIHLDGLADTADGLGSGREPLRALAVMRSGDVGPFGVATLLLVLLVQVAALTELVEDGAGAPAAVIALVASRLTLPVVCSRGIAAARSEGLGHLVAGSVGRAQLLGAFALTALLVLLVGGLSRTVLGLSGAQVAWLTAAAPVGPLAGGLLCWWCVRRLGGVTGDVMGACVEISFTALLVGFSLLG